MNTTVMAHLSRNDPRIELKADYSIDVKVLCLGEIYICLTTEQALKVANVILDALNGEMKEAVTNVG